MKVLDTKIENNNETWFRLELDRSTNILAKELFTQDDVDYQKKQAVREFLDKLYEIMLENNH